MEAMTAPTVTRHPDSLAVILAAWREKGKKIAFVPTMGALHDGHLSLIHEAKKHAACVVVSIYVNPKQFGPNEDFGAYPRTEESDLQKIARAGGDVAYVPTTDIMYPDGYQTKVIVPELAAPLDGASRPGFFDGIATVVTKLFNQVRPDVAVFGEKDFQQLLVIKQMVADLNMPIDVIGAPIIREQDGLAMSSRNRYLDEFERQTAGHLNKIMRQTINLVRSGGPVDMAIDDARISLEKAGLSPIDYFEVRGTPALQLIDQGTLDEHDLANARLFAAVMLGRTRLIDNMSFTD